jgi:predicted nucleic acid-binding protein
VLWVIDTSVLIDHLCGDPRAVGLLLGAVERGHELWSTTLVRTEVLAGVRRGEEEATFDLLNQLRWKDCTVEIAELAASFARRYLRSHPGVDTIDYVVAATARVVEGELKTQNVKHFPMLKGLQPAYR